MADSEEVIIVPVPEGVLALYLVPANHVPTDIQERVRAAALSRWDGLLGELLADLLGGPELPVEVRQADDLPPLPMELLAMMGASPQQLDRVRAATQFVIVSVQSKPGWPPAQEWVTRALALVTAEVTDGQVIDVVNHQILDASAALASLPDEVGRTRLADWVWVNYSADSTGYWCTTTGLVRFGLPELQTLAVPPNVVEAWGQAMTGMARRVVAAWSDALATRPGAPFLELPATVSLSPCDVIAAYDRNPPDQEPPTTRVRLTLDPGADPEQNPFLTIHPPLDWPGSAGEYISGACRDLFGAPASEVRHVQPSQAMDEAIATARAGLAGVRDRFEAGQLGLHDKLLVKYTIPVEHGQEYLWAYVTSWHDPRRILANSADDAIYDPTVRAGRPVVVDAATVVDWAIEHDQHGIVEGAWTQGVLDD